MNKILIPASVLTTVILGKIQYNLEWVNRKKKELENERQYLKEHYLNNQLLSYCCETEPYPQNAQERISRSLLKIEAWENMPWYNLEKIVLPKL